MSTERFAEVERLYHEATLLRPAERAAFLDQACGGDEALRHEVESLLSLPTDAGEFLSRTALEEAARTGHRPWEPHSWPTIPSYTVRRVLGEGGMGVVYLAEQERPFRRLVALKLIKPGMDTRQVVARFETERQALALMDHPNIAAVFDAGSTNEGRPYFVMEYVEGVPITDYCDRGRLSTRDRLALFVHVCAAVQHAHQKGVIHRDLKPSNVLVTERDGQPVPKVIDFGTAKAVGAAWNATATHGGQGMVLGTLEYMSPEQAALSADIDTATDVYSLGVLLYELLVGRLPFDTDELRAAGYDEIRRVIRESDPPKPSVRVEHRSDKSGAAARARQTDAPGLTRQLRGDLDWITLRALEKDRERRYATVAAFATDIGRFLEDQPVDARPPSSTYRIRKFTRRHRGAVAAAVALVLTLTVGISVATALYLRAERASAELEYRNYVITISAADSEIRAGQFAAARERLRTVPNGSRGWEWEHLFLQADTSLFAFVDDGPCAYPPNGRLIKLVQPSGVLVDMSHMDRPGHLSPGPPPYVHQLGIDRLTISADSSRIYLRHCGRLTQWNTATFLHEWLQGTESWVLVGATASGVGLATSRSGESWHLSSGDSWSLTLVDLKGARPTRTIGAVEREPICLDVSADGSLLAVGLSPINELKLPLKEFYPDTFEIWNTVTGRRVRRVAVPKPAVFGMRDILETTCAVRLSQDGSLLATSGASVDVWETESGRVRRGDTLQAGTLAQPIAFSPDGRELAIGRRTGQVALMDVRDVGRPVREFDGGDVIRSPVERRFYPYLAADRKATKEVRAVAFSADGHALVSASGNRVAVWDRLRGTLFRIFEGHDASVAGLALAGSLIYSSDMVGQIRVWSVDGLPAVRRLDGSSFNPRIAVDTAGTYVAGAGLDGPVDVWHLDEGRLLALHAGTPEALPTRTKAAGSPSWLDGPGRRSMEAARRYPTVDGCGSAWPDVLAASVDERYLAYVQGSCVVVHDIATAANLAVLNPFFQSVLSSSRPEPGTPFDLNLTFLPDGAIRIRYSSGVTSARFVSVRTWDWRSKRTLEFQERPLPVYMASADGQRIAIRDDVTGLVTIWDSTRTREIGRIPVPSLGGTLALSPDGRRAAVASATNDPSIRIWDVDTSQLVLTLTDTDSHSRGMAFTSDGRLIAGRVSGGLTIWETQRPNCPQCPKLAAPAK